jgi:serine/threonine protein kinase HipA of HipAB toxin-antitoxin module
MEQIVSIRDAVLKISSDRGISLDQAISQLEDTAPNENGTADKSLVADVNQLEEARKTILSEIVTSLKKHDDLRMVEEATMKKVAALQEQERGIAISVSALSDQKQFLESSISSIEHVIERQVDQSRSSLASLITQIISERLEKNNFVYEAKTEILASQLTDIKTLLQKIDEIFSRFLQDTSIDRKTESLGS